MPENVVLLKSDKKILRGEKDESDYQDYSTRRSQIRTRVQNRGEALAKELRLLTENGESEVAEQLLESLFDESDFVIHSDLRDRVERIESDIERIEERCSEVENLKTELETIRGQLKNVNPKG